ncbi:MAG: gamma-glutamyl-gamma-aminobutyrate hydrolase family protein [Nitrosopumilaceae archaeon]|nr:gamma-glutamyl-gamma-aminobutyrate hydrolase family protein [Nitrosopumilaceae archaeon]
MLLVLDNGSVFTQNLIDFLQTLPQDYKRINSNDFEISDVEKYDSFILSGRRKNDSKMNALNSKIIKHAASEKKPLLGICYGAEMLALTMGGTIKKMNALHRGKEDIEIIHSNPLCEGKITVFESHNYEISKISDSFETLAQSKICKNELIHFKNSRIFGTQFHPEMSIDGNKLIEKFVSL